jgi:hypothetical protein
MFNSNENKSKCRPDIDIVDLIIPPALERCNVMRPTDEDTARSIVGEGVWIKFNRNETHRAGEIFLDVIQEDVLPLRITNPGSKGPNTFGLIPKTRSPNPSPKFIPKAHSGGPIA